jgi:hypothetical protein
MSGSACRGIFFEVAHVDLVHGLYLSESMGRYFKLFIIQMPFA